MISLPDPRSRFLQFIRSKLGRPVLWGAKGEAAFDNVVIESVFDCSGLVTCALFHAGCGDMRTTHNAQKLSDITETTLRPQEADLVFYGPNWKDVKHVAVWLSGAQCLTASGATPQISSILDAIKGRHVVEVRPVVRYRSDYLGVKKNKWLEPKEIQ